VIKPPDSLRLGDHICSIFQNRQQQFAVLVPFVTAGLKAHEKCLYLLDDISQSEVVAEFAAAGTQLQPFLDSHQLVTASAADFYLPDGHFLAEKIIEFAKTAQTQALAEGYSGLRGVGDMTWSAGGSFTSDQITDYESQLNDFFPTSRCTTICQYPENRFSPEELIYVIRTHPYVYVYGQLYENKYFYTPPQYFHPLPHLTPSSYQTIINTLIEG
jgi:hypothetical protein